MREDLLPMLELLPIRIRVGMVLAICEKVLPVLAENETAFSACRAALNDGWKWAKGDSISAIEIYNHMETLGDCETSASREQEINSICAVELTIQYVSWHAFKIELKGVAPQSRPVPNDMADVTENYLSQIIDFAGKADESVPGWVRALLNGNHFKSSLADAHKIGPAISKGNYGL